MKKNIELKNDTIYLGEMGRGVKTNDLCKIIISQLSKGNKEVMKNMINYHMQEIKEISDSLIVTLGGTVVGARTLNNSFYEVVGKLGYTTSFLCSSPNVGTRIGLGR